MVIFLFVLIFFGADKIPGIARTMGKTLRQIREATDAIQQDIKDSAKDVENSLKEATDNANTGIKQIEQQAQDALNGDDTDTPGNRKTQEKIAPAPASGSEFASPADPETTGEPEAAKSTDSKATVKSERL